MIGRKAVAAVVIALHLAGCASSFGRARPGPGQTENETDDATLRCNKEANIAWDESNKGFGAALVGITVIGIPFAIGWTQSGKREYWRECMTRRGFAVAKR